MVESSERIASRGSARLSWTVGAIGLAYIVLHAIGVLDPNGDFTLVAAAVVAVVATIVGLRRWRPQPMWPWLSVAGALGLFLVADVLRLAYGTIGNLSSSRSLVPDMLALPGYALLAIGVAGTAGVGRGDRDDADAILDGVIASLAVLALLWVYLVTPTLDKQDVGVTLEIILAAYPVASVFVLAMGARLMFSSSRETPTAMWLCLVAILFLLIGDVVYALPDLDLADVPSQLADVPYALAFLTYSVAVLHPSIRRVAQRRPSDEMAPTKGRLFWVAVALFVPTIILVTGLRSTNAADQAALAVILVLLVSVAVWRMSRALNQHATSQARLAHQATHDPLTGLPNRSFLAEHIDRAARIQQDVGGSVSVMHIDLDRFKLVNDTMGHVVGDELLVAVADRLSQRVREGDLVGRIGGDEFAVVMRGLDSEAEATDLGERARLMFKEPFSVGGAEISMTVSVGIAFQAARSDVAETLIRDADTAVNHAKAGGGDDVACFDDSMREQVAERLHLERELRHALERGQLSLHYQPKIRLVDGRVVGLEALLRWTHPELGMIRPDKFIPIAEDTGMIVEIGAWVVEEACAELGRLRASMPRGTDIVMSVNVSARQLRSESLVDTIARALLRNRIPADALCFEMTESIVMENLEAVSGQLHMIRDCGSRISIDDFGTGYSSLAYLSKLPVDEIKIDRTFIKDIGQEGNAVSLITAVVYIASSLGISTVAEGVETVEQLEAVASLGCTEAQGYLYSKPVPPDELPEILTQLGVTSRNVLRSIPTGRRVIGSIA